MSIRGRKPRWIVLAAIALSFSSMQETARSQKILSDLPTGQRLSRNFYPEVRLRKLHLVRPDLIPYPIAYEVYC